MTKEHKQKLKDAADKRWRDREWRENHESLQRKQGLRLPKYDT